MPTIPKKPNFFLDNLPVITLLVIVFLNIFILFISLKQNTMLDCETAYRQLRKSPSITFSTKLISDCAKRGIDITLPKQ